MAEPVQRANSSELMTDALQMMRDALELLDRAQAPGDIGAHLDLAVVRLSEIVQPDSNGG